MKRKKNLLNKISKVKGRIQMIQLFTLRFDTAVSHTFYKNIKDGRVFSSFIHYILVGNIIEVKNKHWV